jgi:hypothetical protein
LPSQIAGLPDFYGYLRAGGSHMVARVKVEFDGLPRRGEQPDFVDQPQRALPRYTPQGEATAEGGKAADATGAGSEAHPAPEELATSTDHETEQEATMEAMMQQYSMKIEAATADFVAEYGEEFMASLDDEDIDAFAEILANRVDLQQNGAQVEG